LAKACPASIEPESIAPRAATSPGVVKAVSMLAPSSRSASRASIRLCGLLLGLAEA
jgi:hypothetical protein